MQLAQAVSILINPPKSSSLGSEWNSLVNYGKDQRCCAAVRAVISVADSGNFNRSKSLVLNASSAGGVTEVEYVVAEEMRSVAFKVLAGKPVPFGATARDGGVNFAIFSSGALSATLCLFSLSDLKANKVTEQIPLDPLINKTGDAWHIFLEGEIKDMLYGYKFDGKFCPEEGHCFDNSRVLLDLYSMFDWEGDFPLRYPQKDLIVYEMHVRGYTKHDSSKTDYPGTYLGAVDKLDHLKELGVNCLELMPSQEFNKLEYFNYNSVPGESKLNFWGYSTVNYFLPMMRYSFAGIANSGRDAINEFKTLVREAHKQGIEVVLDVVFNHTAEGNEKGQFTMCQNTGFSSLLENCGNTFNCNHSVVRQFILDCLRQWDAGNVYGRPIEGDPLTTGTPLSRPPLIDMISNDPIHRGIKYRDIVRQFIKGTDGFSGAFAKCLCGSPNLYQGGGRKPWNSINFITTHDGFTLADLVTYNNKNNSSDCEDNRDGENHNLSWNCGEEGEFASIAVRRPRDCSGTAINPRGARLISNQPISGLLSD